jgi:hypothetical protein
MSQVTQKKAFCSKCGGNRNCEIQGRFLKSENDGPISWAEQWFILQCRGCDEVFCQKIETFSEDYDHEYDEYTNEWHLVPNEKTSYWPALLKRKRPDWLEKYGIQVKGVDDTLDKAILEVYGALDNDLLMLATTGIRTVFDVVSLTLDIDGTLSFERKLEKLLESGKISETDKEHLSVLVEAGSATIHRGWRPSVSELNTIVDILEEFILNSIVKPSRRAELSEKAVKLKEKVPPRQKVRRSDP